MDYAFHAKRFETAFEVLRPGLQALQDHDVEVVRTTATQIARMHDELMAHWSRYRRIIGGVENEATGNFRSNAARALELARKLNDHRSRFPDSGLAEKLDEYIGALDDFGKTEDAN